MRILIAAMPFEGHRAPVRVFMQRLVAELPELVLERYEAPPLRDVTPTHLAGWYERFREQGTSVLAQAVFARTIIRFAPDVILADPAVFGALPIARALRIPIGMLGNLPVLYVDERPVLQFAVPAFELEPFRSLARITYVGPMADLEPPCVRCSRLPRPRIHVTQGTLVTDPEVLLGPMKRTGLAYTADAWPYVRLPHAHLFPHLDLLVTTGGYGAVSRAIAAGVPVLVTGTTEDKPAVGERVMRAGAGLYVPTSDPGELADACSEILGDTRYRANAGALRAECGVMRRAFAKRVTHHLEAVQASVPADLPESLEKRRSDLRARARAALPTLESVASWL